MWKKFYKTSVLLISLYDIKKYYRAVKIEFISNIGFRGALHFVTHENCILIFFFFFALVQSVDTTDCFQWALLILSEFHLHMITNGLAL